MRVPLDEAEIGRARFLTLAPEGFEEVEVGDELELVAYTDRPGEHRFRRMYPALKTAAVEPGWEEGWRKFHSSMRVADLWIGPPWETPPTGVRAVVVDPGRAFGTGAHATTRACLELLATTSRGSVLDAGCGSGVLSIAAAQLGFGPIVAVDVDEAAVEATRANASRNGVELDVLLLDVLRDDVPPAELLVANIEREVVEMLLRRWKGSSAITSGYLEHERPEVPGWQGEERVELEGWAADRLLRQTTV